MEKIKERIKKLKENFKKRLETNPTLRPFFLMSKQREFNHTISFEELSQLLQVEFEDFKSRYHPLEEEFDPKLELEKIKQAEKSTRVEALQLYKEKYKIQKTALAQCRLFIERLIRQNPDIDSGYLQSVLEKFSQNYGFSKDQILTINNLLDKFQVKRSEILFLREKFKDDRELFTFVTGIKLEPKDNVKVLTGPMNFCFRVSSGLADKAYFDTYAYGEDFWKKSSIKGFAVKFENRQLEGKNFNVSAIFMPIEVGESPEEKFSDLKTLIHEEEHVTNSLLHEYFFQEDFKILESNPDLLKSKEEVDSFLKKFYSYMILRTRDEFTAKVIGRTGTETSFQKGLLGPSSYNYIRPLEFRTDTYDEGNVKDYWKSGIHFLKIKYDLAVKQCSSAFWKLVDEEGYSIDEAVALLTDVPLLEWPLEVKRILEFRRTSKR
jgi:hypothetical protein